MLVSVENPHITRGKKQDKINSPCPWCHVTSPTPTHKYTCSYTHSATLELSRATFTHARTHTLTHTHTHTTFTRHMNIRLITAFNVKDTKDIFQNSDSIIILRSNPKSVF